MTAGFTIPASPVPAARPRVARSGAVYYPKAHSAYANYLREFLKTIPKIETNGPVDVSIMFVMPRYKTSDHPVHRSDVDNLSKLPMDEMTKSVMEGGETRFWTDDHFVVVLRAFKRFVRDGEEPHTKVRIKTIEGNVEDYIDDLFEEKNDSRT